MAKKKSLTLLATCKKNCDQCNTVIIRVLGHLDKLNVFEESIEGDILIEDAHKIPFLKDMKMGKRYLLTISPCK